MNKIKLKFIPALASCCLLLVYAALPSQTNGQQESKVTKTAEVEGVTEYVLENGCKVLLYPDESSNSVTVNMTVFVGSRHEGYGETGMAHLLEHMLFKGTPKHADIDKELKAKGMLNMNGTTWYDRTNYFETLPASDENMDWAIAMEADRLVNCFIRGEDLASEMTVVRSEFERSENSPVQVLMSRLMANAYDWHNYGKSVIGNKADIERVPIPSLRAFYEKYYRPDNIIVVIAGKFDPKKAVASAATHFGALKNPKTPLPKTYTTEPIQDGERIVYLNRTGEVPAVGVGYHIPAVAHPDHAPLLILDWILGDEPSGRLYKSLVKANKASRVFTRIEAGHDPGMLTCMAMVESTEEAESFRKEMTESIESIIEESVTSDEVARAIAVISKQKEDAVVNSARFAMTLSDWSAYGDWRLFYLIRDRIAEVTPADVQRVAETYLKRSNRTVAMFVPTKEPNRSTIPSTPKVADLVKDYKGRATVSAGEAFEPTPENIASRMKQGKFESGVEYTLLPKKTRGERFHARLTLRFGDESSLNDRQKINACRLMGQMIKKGTENLSRQEIEDKETELKSRITITSGLGQLAVSVEGRKEFLDETLELINDLVRKPAFPAEEFELLKSQQVAQLMQLKSEPNMICQMRVTRELTPVSKGDIHYVPTIAESIEDLKSADITHIQQLYSEFVSGAHGEFTLLGDYDDEAAVMKKMETMLADWNKDASFKRITSEPRDIDTNSINIETPDKANAMYMQGANIDSKSDDPDWEALMIAADILGGSSLSSRLGETVREQEGLSYAVGCRFTAGSIDRAGRFLTFAITNPANRDKLIKTIQGVYDKTIEEGFTEKELKDATTTYKKRIEESLVSDQALIGILHRYQYLDQDMEFLQKRLKRIDALTTEDLTAAAKKLLKADAIAVAAGDFANAKEADKVQSKKEDGEE